MIIEVNPYPKSPYDYFVEDKDARPENPYLDEDEELRRLETMDKIWACPSDFVQFAIYMPAKGGLERFSFQGRRYLKAIYDSPAKRKLLMAGRQVEKSTMLGNMCLAYCAMNNYFRVLYVSPSNQQTKVFSRDRIKEPMEISPVLRNYTNKKLLANVLEKKLTTRSQITLRFAFLNADRCRGIPADLINIDEFQDIILDNIPVIEECASHSAFKLFLYSGTPKSLDNSLEHYWTRFSTQNEWVVPCRHHGTPKNPASWHWNILEENHIGEKSLVCDRCGNPIDPADPDCKWVALNPNPRVEKPFEGYRLPQLMVPWIEFSDIKDKQRKYSRAKFHNEVLGRSYDSGTRPLRRQDVRKNCWPDLSMQYYRDVVQYTSQYPVFLGVDWGCHDEESRILTPSGFKHFRDLTDMDKVAQFDPDTREMTFVKPQVRTVRDWDGDLLHFEGKGLDMMLTPTHRMLIKSKHATQWHVEPAGDLVGRSGQVKFVGSVWWKGVTDHRFTLPGLPTSAGYSGCESKSFRMNDWLEFLGYYLSEGGRCTKPACLKLSQRESVNPEKTAKIRACMVRLGIEFSEYPNYKTGDVNWTICGKQFWKWVDENIGATCDSKRIPRQFLELSQYQLQILFDAMMLGDGSLDPREGNRNGCYMSTSKGLCEDFQELCIRLGLRSTLSLHRPASGNRKTGWRVSWSYGRDFAYNDPCETDRVPYKGKVYCCKVPKGFIVTERHGRIGYQGNTGEGSYTVVALGGYLPFNIQKFTYFYFHRFEGIESEPKFQIDTIVELARTFNVRVIGADYGGGHWPNDELVREFGAEKVKKYQWVGNVKKKVAFEPRLGVPRFLCHRTEVMSDIFNAIKRANVFTYPRWEEFENPYAADFLNIFSEYNDRLRMNVYRHAPGCPDDSFHAAAYCFLASFFYRTRPDVILPTKELDREREETSEEDLDVV